MVFWGLSQSIGGEKVGQTSFITEEIAFFFQKPCVFNNLSGDTELIF